MEKWIICLLLVRTIKAAIINVSDETTLTTNAITTFETTEISPVYLKNDIIESNPLPIVLWHGMGDTCCFEFSLGSFTKFLKAQIPDVEVVSLRIGRNTVEDFEHGYFMHPDDQIRYVCEVLANEVSLQAGFNAIGFSQGSQFMRGVIQKCGHKIPPVKNFISLGGQHQGVYGIPNCAALQHKSCDYIRKVLNYAAYAKWVQDSLVQATYWHDPLDEKTYKTKSTFLSDINNEVKVNKTYIENLNRLQNFVLVKFGNDSIVQPRETEWFGFYAPGQAKKIQKLQKSDLYLQDRIGLKRMNEEGRLKFLSTPGDHLQFPQQWFIDYIIKPYLL